MAHEAPPRVALLTDFGNRDGYVGVMKGVMSGILPELLFIDIGHDIPPQDVRAAAFLLAHTFRYFPVGTVFLVVVDPGVGSARRGIAVSSGQRWFVGPDNGLFEPVLEGARIRSLEERDLWLPAPSHTFHGRDIFAPVAAHLAAGIPFETVGPEILDPVRLDLEGPTQGEGHWVGEVVYRDGFGNLVTNFHRSLVESLQGLPGSLVAISADGTIWPVTRTYSDVEPEFPCAVVGGFENLELSVNRGNAAERSGLSTGAPVRLERRID